MRGLKVAVVGMGVLIVAGVAVIVVVLVQRMSSVPGTIASAVLDEAAGTRIAGTSMSADRLAVQLEGGGPDRVVVLDLRSGRVLGRVALGR
ncbi:MAG TPA: hypothetical protein VE650_15355 [Acetobacteraceae bacterium]|nr:hypothetical protein [Acetobacteraceae bacterium]